MRSFAKTAPLQVFVPRCFRSCMEERTQATASEYNSSLDGMMEEMEPLTNLATTRIIALAFNNNERRQKQNQQKWKSWYNINE